jgi:hypothetical protein
LEEKDKKMEYNFTNTWAGTDKKKKNIYDVSIRLGKLTVLELYCNPGVEHRAVLFNFGVCICGKS